MRSTRIIIYTYIYIGIFIQKILHIWESSHRKKKTGNWFAIAKLREKYPKKKEILSKTTCIFT